uniref:Monocarboxylate transporter n=1 Tax=Strigamia maritima TaxID=126957 RepID=T1JMS3_STRMM
MEAAVASSRAKLLRTQSLPAFENCLLSISDNKWRNDLLIADRPPTASTANADHNKVNGNKKSATIRQHYYPEAGWGWVITICASYVLLICHGLHMAYGILYLEILQKFGRDRQLEAVFV